MEWKEAPWDKFVTGAPRTVTRQAISIANLPRGHARRQSCNTAIHWLAGHFTAMSREAQASTAPLSRGLGINPKTVAKWRGRATVADLKTGPKEPRSTVLSEAEEAMVVAFRRHALLPLDDCLDALQPSIPHPTRSALHRCLQRHGLSRLPDVDGDKPKRQRFKRDPIGFFHIRCPAGACAACCRVSVMVKHGLLTIFYDLSEARWRGRPACA